jgi:hypothetical protein
MKHDDMKEDKPLIKKIAKQEVKSHEKKMHGMKKGGVTGESMRKVGRNMARANNQRGR